MSEITESQLSDGAVNGGSRLPFTVDRPDPQSFRCPWCRSRVVNHHDWPTGGMTLVTACHERWKWRSGDQSLCVDNPYGPSPYCKALAEDKESPLPALAWDDPNRVPRPGDFDYMQSMVDALETERDALLAAVKAMQVVAAQHIHGDAWGEFAMIGEEALNGK